MSDSVWPCGLQPARLLCPWDSPGKNTGVGCCAHLQGIFPTQELNPKSLTSPALEGGFFTTGTSGKLQEEGLLRAKSISESAWRYEEHCPSPQDTETFLVDHLIFKWEGNQYQKPLKPHPMPGIQRPMIYLPSCGQFFTKLAIDSSVEIFLKNSSETWRFKRCGCGEGFS